MQEYPTESLAYLKIDPYVHEHLASTKARLYIDSVFEKIKNGEYPCKENAPMTLIKKENDQ